MADLKTETFTGMDESDLNRKVWDWQTKNLVTIIKSHTDERLPINVKSPHPGSKIKFSDQWSRRIDYLQR